MKGMVGIGEDRTEEGEVSSITQHRQIERRRRTQDPAHCTIENTLETAPIHFGNYLSTNI